MPQLEEILAQPFGSVPDLIAFQTQARPQHTALIEGDSHATYAQLNALMDRVATALQRDGLVPGDVIAVCASSSIAYMATFLGALRAGVVVAPLAPSATADHLSAMLANSHLALAGSRRGDEERRTGKLRFRHLRH